MAKPVQVDENTDGGTINMCQQTLLRVRLPENRVAGFRWHFRNDGHPILSLLGDAFEPNPAGIGGPGTHVWTFTAEQNGETRIELGYGRSWRSPTEFVRTFSLQVNVRPN